MSREIGPKERAMRESREARYADSARRDAPAIPPTRAGRVNTDGAETADRARKPPRKKAPRKE
jgi:hypothetical protein